MMRFVSWTGINLSEHIWEAARALYGDDNAAKHWASRCHGLLRESSGIGLLRYLQHSRRSRGSASGRSGRLEALDSLIDYLRPRLAITDYVEYRQWGFVIGSGMMESMCKQLVGQRLKGNGRQWSKPGAVAMTALIAQPINRAWNAFWAAEPHNRHPFGDAPPANIGCGLQLTSGPRELD